MSIAREQFSSLGIKADMLAEDTWSFTVNGIPIILQPGESVSTHDGRKAEVYDGSFYHVSDVSSRVDPLIMELAVEDSGFCSGALIRYLKEKNQVGFFCLSTLLDPSTPEENLASGIYEIIESWSGVQERYETIARMVRFAKDSPTDMPVQILIPAKDQFQACMDFHEWGPKMCTGDIGQTLEVMGYEFNTVDLMDESIPRKPILFWSGKDYFLIQDEGGTPVLYAKRPIDPNRKESYFQILRTLSLHYSRVEYNISGNICTVKMHLPEDTDHKNLEKRLWICTSRLTQFLHELIDQATDAKKVEYSQAQMKQFLVYEVIQSQLME